MTKELVVVVHGLSRTRASMLAMQHAASCRGYRAINFPYASRRSSIQQQADALARYLDRSLRADDARVHFITHSLGGIVVRAFLAQREFPKLGRVVMLAPPNRGSDVAERLGRKTWARLLAGRPLAELGTSYASFPNGLPQPSYEVGVIAGKYDGKVRVERTRLESMTDFAIVPHTHTFLPWSPDVMALSLRFLAVGHFGARE